MQSINTKFLRLDRKLYLAIAVAMVCSIILASFGTNKTEALTISSRSVTLSNNTNAATGATYTFTATVPTGGNTTLGSIEVDLCGSASGPLLGSACAAPAGLAFVGSTLTGMAPAGGTPTLSGAATGQTPFASLGTGATAARIRISYATPQAVTAGSTVVSFNITGITNPNVNGTFFARMGFFSDNAFTTFTDAGAMANSIQTNQNVSFKIQETLTFCVGVMPNATVPFYSGSGAVGTTFAGTAALTDACAQSAGTALSLGLANDSVTTCITPVTVRSASCDDPAAGANDAHYAFSMVRTNASLGVTIGFRPSAPAGYANGVMQGSGATCGGFASANRNDNCINPVNEDQSTALGTADDLPATSALELFGMAVPAVNRQGRATTALNRNSAATGYGYTGDVAGTCTGGTSTTNCWNWHRTGSGTLASSTAPVDYEAIEMLFATKPGITTPSGQYDVFIDYFANPTY